MNYRDINEVQDLYSLGILKKPLNEGKDDKGNKKGADNKKTLNPNAEHFDVHYAEEIKQYTNIFKHIIRIIWIDAKTVSVYSDKKHIIKKAEITVNFSKTAFCFWFSRTISCATREN